MRFVRLWLCVVVASMWIVPGASAVPIQGLFNTGVDPAGAVLPDGSLEVHYTLTGPSSPAIVATPHSLWIAAPTGSAWIGPTAGTSNDPEGTYIYTLTFDLTGLDSSTASISGQWASDNSALIFLNGASTGHESLSEVQFSNFVISSGFVTGQNALAFEVTNAPGSELPGWNPTSLLIAGLSGSATPIPEPSTALLLGIGLAGLGMRRRTRRGC